MQTSLENLGQLERRLNMAVPVEHRNMGRQGVKHRLLQVVGHAQGFLRLFLA